MTSEQRTANRRRLRELDFARSAPYGDKNSLSLPDPTNGDDDQFVSVPISPLVERVMDRLFWDWWEGNTPNFSVDPRKRRAWLDRPKSEEDPSRPVITNRRGRMKSVGDMDGATLERERIGRDAYDGWDSVVTPIDEGAFSAWFDQVWDRTPLSDETHSLDDQHVYTEEEYRAVARRSDVWRSLLNDGKLPIGSDRHDMLADLDQRMKVGDDFARELRRIVNTPRLSVVHEGKPRKRTRAEEAAALGISERTWRRWRAEGMTEQAAA